MDSIFDETGLIDDKPQDECGIFGIWAPGEDVASLTYFGLYALQHRGQESAGIAITNGRHVRDYKAMGLVSQVFDRSILSLLLGKAAIGHNRYSTTGGSTLANAQPFLVHGHKGSMALAHNGNLTNAESLLERLERSGMEPRGSTDSEIMALTITQSWKRHNIYQALKESLPKFNGGFGLVLLTKNMLVAARDMHGIRPVVVGKFRNKHWVIASETCALDIIGAELVRELAPGEAVVIRDHHDKTKMQADFFYWTEKRGSAFCSFEYIYFARPDSVFQGHRVHNVRQRLGALLARSKPVEADVVIGVPDSATPHAIGFAAESGIPYREGLIKNRYVGRTFINPEQLLREQGIRIKLNPLKEYIDGKRVVLVDDSIVRGNTSRKIVQLIRDSGATEVHVRVASPPFRFPCYYGVDTPLTKELIAFKKDEQQMADLIGADSCGYLSQEAMVEAIEVERGKLCMGCFSNIYPTKIFYGQQELEFEKNEHGFIPLNFHTGAEAEEAKKKKRRFERRKRKKRDGTGA